MSFSLQCHLPQCRVLELALHTADGAQSLPGAGCTRRGASLGCALHAIPTLEWPCMLVPGLVQIELPVLDPACRAGLIHVTCSVCPEPASFAVYCAGLEPACDACNAQVWSGACAACDPVPDQLCTLDPLHRISPDWTHRLALHAGLTRAPHAVCTLDQFCVLCSVCRAEVGTYLCSTWGWAQCTHCKLYMWLVQDVCSMQHPCWTSSLGWIWHMRSVCGSIWPADQGHASFLAHRAKSVLTPCCKS